MFKVGDYIHYKYGAEKQKGVTYRYDNVLYMSNSNNIHKNFFHCY
jgi:hypothetical protein